MSPFLAWRGQYLGTATQPDCALPDNVSTEPHCGRLHGTRLLRRGVAARDRGIGGVLAFDRALAIDLWFAAATVLSLPWVGFWTRKPALRPFAATAAVLLCAVPPLPSTRWAHSALRECQRIRLDVTETKRLRTSRLRRGYWWGANNPFSETLAVLVNANWAKLGQFETLRVSEFSAGL